MGWTGAGLTGPGPLGAVPPQGRHLALDAGETPAHLLAQLLVALLNRLQPPFDLLVAPALPLRRRADALLQRTLQRLAHPPGQLPGLGAVRHRLRVNLQHPRRTLVPLVPHQLLQQRHEPHVVDVLHVLAAFDAVFGSFHRIFSFSRIALSFGPVSTSVSDRRHAPPHPPQITPGFPTDPQHYCRVYTPTSSEFQRREPEPGLSTKCSLFTSCRGVIYPCFSLPTTRPTTSRRKSLSCTPPLLHVRGRNPSALKGTSSDKTFR